ncbi:MAG: endolytic transglycosylase MltG [Alkalibacterium sp.]|nr:endolytic transglycosylase MltG [Alkalibacterium sp.]
MFRVTSITHFSGASGDAESNQDVPIEITYWFVPDRVWHEYWKRNDIIRSAFVFNYHLRFTGEEGFQAGYYLFSPSMATDEIVSHLQEGGCTDFRRSFRKYNDPGRLHCRADRRSSSSSRRTIHSDDFFELIESDDFLSDKAEEFPDLLSGAMDAEEETLYTLEGYLYPATYEFLDDTTLEGLVTQMINRMDQVF